MDKRFCKCGIEIPQARIKILPNTKTCVNCSDVQTKKAIIVQQGEGDHTYNETIFLEHEQYEKYVEAENKLRKQMKLTSKPEKINLDDSLISFKEAVYIDDKINN